MNPSKTSTTTVDIQAGEATFRASSTRVVEKGFQKALTLLASKEQTKALPVTGGRRARWTSSSSIPSSTSPRDLPGTPTPPSSRPWRRRGSEGRPPTPPSSRSCWTAITWCASPASSFPRSWERSSMTCLRGPSPSCWTRTSPRRWRRSSTRWRRESRTGRRMIRDFYGPFKGKVASVLETLESVKGVMDEKTDVVCEVCGRPMVKKLGRYGFFLACTGFPECKNTKPVPLAPCPRPGLRRADRGAQAQARTGAGVLRLHELSHVRFRDVLQAHGLQVPEVRLVPRGERGQAAGDVQVLHQPVLRLPAYEGGGRTKCLRNISPTCAVRAQPLSPYPGVLREGPAEVRGVPGGAGGCPRKAGLAEARGFVGRLSRDGLSARSVNRIVSGVRGWYRYMERAGEIDGQSLCRDPQPPHGKAPAFVPLRG